MVGRAQAKRVVDLDFNLHLHDRFPTSIMTRRRSFPVATILLVFVLALLLVGFHFGWLTFRSECLGFECKFDSISKKHEVVRSKLTDLETAHSSDAYKNLVSAVINNPSCSNTSIILYSNDGKSEISCVELVEFNEWMRKLEEYEPLKAGKEASTSERESFAAELETLKEKIKELEKDKGELNEKLEGASMDNDIHAKAQQELEKKVAEYEAKIAEYEGKVGEYEVKAAESVAKIAESEAKVAELLSRETAAQIVNTTVVNAPSSNETETCAVSEASVYVEDLQKQVEELESKLAKKCPDRFMSLTTDETAIEATEEAVETPKVDSAPPSDSNNTGDNITGISTIGNGTSTDCEMQYEILKADFVALKAEKEEVDRYAEDAASEYEQMQKTLKTQEAENARLETELVSSQAQQQNCSSMLSSQHVPEPEVGFNVAQRRIGAEVMRGPDFTSPTFSRNSALGDVLEIWPLQKLHIDTGVGSPEDALSDDMRIGSCWPMKVSSELFSSSWRCSSR
jgi:predicted nuclease with TOPRIM domain